MRALQIHLASNKLKYGFGMAIVMALYVLRLSVNAAEQCPPQCFSGEVPKINCPGSVGNKCTMIGQAKVANLTPAESGFQNGGPDCGKDEGGDPCGWTTSRACP